MEDGRGHIYIVLKESVAQHIYTSRIISVSQSRDILEQVSIQKRVSMRHSEKVIGNDI